MSNIYKQGKVSVLVERERLSEELVVNFIQPGRTITHTYKLSEVFQKQERRNLEIIVKLVVKADSHSMNEIYKPNLSQQATLTILGGKGGKEGVIRYVITRGERGVSGTKTMASSAQRRR